MKKTQMVGALLWRGGIVFAAVAGTVESARWILRLVNVPDEVELGLGLLVSGFVLLLASLLFERIQDYRTETSLSE